MFGNQEDYTSDLAAETMVRDTLNWVMNEDPGRKTAEDRWRGNIKLYNIVHDMDRLKSAKYPYESDLVLPTVLTHCEGCMTQIGLSLLSNSPMARVSPKKRGAVEAARVTGWVMQDMLDNDIDIRFHLPQWLRSSMQNTTWLKIGWTTTATRVLPKTFNPQTGKWSANEEAIVSKGHGTMEECDSFNLWQDPWAPEGDVDKCRFIVERLIWTPEQLDAFVNGAKKTYRGGKEQDRPWGHQNIKAAIAAAKRTAAKDKKGDGKHDSPDLSQEERQKLMADMGRTGGYTASDKDERLIQVWDWWEDEVHMMFVGDATKLKCILREGNPFEHGKKPYLSFAFIRSKYGCLSVCDIIGDLATEKNTRRNQRMDNVKRGINKQVFYNKHLVDGDLLASRPYGQVPVKAMPKDAVMVADGGDVTQQAYIEGDLIDRDIELAAGYTRQLSQGGGAAEDTARGLAMRMQASNARFEMTVGDYAAVLRRAVKLLHAMARQFWAGTKEEEGEVPALDGEGKRVFLEYTYEDIDQDFGIEFTTDPNRANPAQHAQQLVNIIAAGGGIPEAAAMVEWAEVWRELFIAAGYRDDAKRFIKGMDSTAIIENRLFLEWRILPPVAEGQDDDEHLEAHDGLENRLPLKEMEDEAIQEAFAVINAHRQMHLLKRQREMGEARRTEAMLDQGVAVEMPGAENPLGFAEEPPALPMGAAAGAPPGPGMVPPAGQVPPEAPVGAEGAY